VATSGVASATLLGTLIVTLAVLGADVLRSGLLAGPPGSAATQPAGPTAAALLVGGTFGGFALAAAFAWWLLSPIGSLYRRTALAISSGFGTVVLMLVGMPVHHYFGQPGLIGLALLLALGAASFAFRARRATRDP
jgi:hypothetical protein